MGRAYLSKRLGLVDRVFVPGQLPNVLKASPMYTSKYSGWGSARETGHVARSAVLETGTVVDVTRHAHFEVDD